MFRQSYAHARFSIFCEKFADDFTHEINKVLSTADDALFDLENEVLGMHDALTADADRYLSRETHRIKRETLTALQSVINGFFDDVQPLPPAPVKKPARDRIIHRDVACRYLRIFGGHTEWVKTDVDAGYPVLIDKDGDRRGAIDAFDRFPGPEAKALSAEVLSEIPF